MVTAISPSAARPQTRTIDPPALAAQLLARHVRGSQYDVAALRREVEALKAQDGRLGAEVERLVKAGLPAVEQVRFEQQAVAIRAPDGSTLTIRDDAPTVADYRAMKPGSAGRAFYDRLDTLFGDGNPKTDDTAKIDAGINRLLASGMSLEQAEALQAADAPARLAKAGDVNGARELMRQRPDQIDVVLRAFAAERPGLVPQLVEGSAAIVEAQLAQAVEQPSLSNRIWGGVRALGGGVEAVVGGALVLAPEPTMLTKVGGGIMAVHGADNFVAGFRQAWSGLPAESMTQQGAEKLATELGADPVTAGRIGVGVDIGVGFLGSGLASLGRLASSSRLVWTSIKATQPVYEGTVIPRSFEMAAGGTKVWVHGNGTKHLAEYANAMLNRGVSQNLVRVVTQVQLTSLQAAIGAAGKQGIVYGQVMRVGGWELIFAAPREAGLLPVLKHALPLG